MMSVTTSKKQPNWRPEALGHLNIYLINIIITTPMQTLFRLRPPHSISINSESRALTHVGVWLLPHLLLK